jgi:hypothetical protein
MDRKTRKQIRYKSTVENVWRYKIENKPLRNDQGKCRKERGKIMTDQ